MSARRTLRRVHVWLGWAIGLPLVFWTASGLWMAARPIEEVRGTALRRPPAPLVLPAMATPPRAARSLAIEMQRGRPVWIVDGERRADVATGRALPPPDAREAAGLARAAFAGTAALVGISRTAADAPPLDLRRPRPAWQATFADETHVYIDAGTGSVLALRSAQWRWYDWMWGLHIMDLQGREATSHATLILFAGLALVGSLLAIVLLPLSSRRRKAR